MDDGKRMMDDGRCKMDDSGYQFKYTFEEAIADWYKDNKEMYLE